MKYSLECAPVRRIGGDREVQTKLGFCEQLQLYSVCSGGTFHMHRTLGMLKVSTQSNLKKWWEPLSTDITFVSGDSRPANSWRLGKEAGGIGTSMCLVFLGCPTITLAGNWLCVSLVWKCREHV